MSIPKYLVGSLFLVLLLTNFALANDAALIVRNSNDLSLIHEKKVKTALEEMGFNVVLIDNIQDVDFSRFSLIVVAGRPGNVYPYENLDDSVSQVPVNDYPTVVIGSHFLDDWGWAEAGAMSTATSSRMQRIKITDNTNPITSAYDVDEIVTVHIVEGKSILDIAKRRSKLTQLASLTSTGETTVIGVAEPDTELYDGKSTKARVVFFGITNPLYWSDEAKDLFKNTVWWVIADVDDDGVLDHKDNCKFVSNPDQRDIDGDGLGDACDKCPNENAIGYDLNKDGCIDDTDLDGIKDNVDNCPKNYNPDQLDTNGDGIGDKCNILPGASVYLDVDGDGVDESATNKNNVIEDGYEFYNDPNSNTNVVKLDGDGDGFTDFLINIDVDGYDKYWDPDNGVFTNVTKSGNEYFIDTNGDGKVDKVWDSTSGQMYGIVERDVDGDSRLERALDTNNDGSFDSYSDDDSSTTLLSIENGDKDGKNDFVIGLGKPEKYWDPDNDILTTILEKDVNNDGINEYVVDINNDGKYDKVYAINTFYDFPDLIIESFSVSSTSVKEGESVSVSATIKNVGGYNATNFTVTFNTGSKAVTLQPGQTDKIDFTLSNLAEGQHSASIFVDSGDLIMESNEANNQESATIQVSSSTPVVSQRWGGGGKAVSEVKLAQVTGFPEKVVVKQGETKEVTGQFFSNLTYIIPNITLSLSGEGFNQSWATIEPAVIDSVDTNDTKNIKITFTVPEDAKIYTYPLTLKAFSNRNGVTREYETKINLIIEEKTVETTTTTTIPEEPEERKSPLSGVFTLIKTNMTSIAIGILFAGIFMLLLVFRNKIPRLEFKLKETKQHKYSYGKGWKEK